MKKEIKFSVSMTKNKMIHYKIIILNPVCHSMKKICTYSKIFQEIGIQQFIQLLSTSKVALHTTLGILLRQITMLIKDCVGL